MEAQYTRWQTRRRSLPDQKKSGNGWILGKSCLTLHLTYQIYNLAEEAEQQKAILRLIIPQKCKLSPELTDFLKEHKYVKDIILSNSVVDMTGGTVNVSGDLGQISGDSTIRRINIDDANDLENTLYFELAVKDKNGKESVYQLQMSLTEITQNHSN